MLRRVPFSITHCTSQIAMLVVGVDTLRAISLHTQC